MVEQKQFGNGSSQFTYLNKTSFVESEGSTISRLGKCCVKCQYMYHWMIYASRLYY